MVSERTVKLEISSSNVCHGVRPLVDPFRSHVSGSLFRGLPRFLLPVLNENNIKIAVITESKKKFQGTKETEQYTGSYSGVDRHIRGQSGVMIWVHKSISNKIDHYKFWNDIIIETRLKTQRRHLTILEIYLGQIGQDACWVKVAQDRSTVTGFR